MKQLLQLCIALSFCQLLSAQAIVRDAITNSALITNSTNGTISSSFGQSVIGKTNSNNTIVTQGFQQVDLAKSVGSFDVLNDSNFQIYPNPNQGEFSVILNPGESMKARLEIRSILGQVLETKALKIIRNQKQIEQFRINSNGLHNVLLRSENGQILFSQTIIINN